MANTKKAAPKKVAAKKKQRPTRLNTGEAVNAFAGFLTMRKSPIICSSHHNAAPMAELVAAFIKSNKLTPVREEPATWKWPDPALDELTNAEPQPMAAVNCRQMTKDEALEKMLAMLREFNGQDQNQIVAIILNEMTQDREKRIEDLEKERAHVEDLLEKVKANYEGFQNVRGHGFEKLNFRGNG